MRSALGATWVKPMSAVQLLRGAVSRAGFLGVAGRASSSYRVQCLLAGRCQKEKRLNRRESVPTEREREREREGESWKGVCVCWPADITGSAGSFTPLAQAKIFLLACASVSMHDTVACILTFLFWCVSPPCAPVLRELRRRGMWLCNIIYA